jgi:hypothetical protein
MLEGLPSKKYLTRPLDRVVAYGKVHNSTEVTRIIDSDLPSRLLICFAGDRAQPPIFMSLLLRKPVLALAR